MPGGKKDAKDDMEVEGEGAEAKDGEGETKEEKKPELRPEEIVRDSCKSSLELIERSVTTKEPRFFSRAMRQTAGARKKMNLVAINAVLGCLPDSELKALALRHVAAAPEAPPAEMDVDAGPEAESAAAGGGELDVGGLAVPVLECEVYLFIVAIHYLLDRKCVPRPALPLPSHRHCRQGALCHFRLTLRAIARAQVRGAGVRGVVEPACLLPAADATILGRAGVDGLVLPLADLREEGRAADDPAGAARGAPDGGAEPRRVGAGDLPQPAAAQLPHPVRQRGAQPRRASRQAPLTDNLPGLGTAQASFQTTCRVNS